MRFIKASYSETDEERIERHAKVGQNGKNVKVVAIP